ncbi:S8 family serine peptidase [Massilia endophytica]|uniref:S8 family serine peptidase n=1 Tax=Massilia endophytica TaxID=2899220 RepID=UPI001E3FFFB7|nr:S8 family serine peptidase [Massilia endophytica]UGQ46395.1 S8 family serine peptidase [Massilia endophytica]
MRTFRTRNGRWLLALLLCGAGGTAHAQLGLPSLPLPQRLGLDTQQLTRPAERLLDRNVIADLRTVRAELVRKLLAEQARVVEADPVGQPVRRGEILAWAPGEAGRSAARALGLAVLREENLEGSVLLVLRVPENLSTVAALAQLRAADPEGSYDFNHLYNESGSAPGVPAAQDSGRLRVGLIDAGVDGEHPVFQGTEIVRWGCGGSAVPSSHGTAVAALMVGRSERFHGALPEARLYAADIYCGDAASASVDRIAGALAWMAREKVGVVNISLVGPANQALERAVAAMVAKGHLLVAAVGNDGPAAPPLYPASYPGVVGVSAVDRQGRPLPEAARGAQVMFAAPGSQMVSATVGAPPYRQVRGTSFASPIVAALLAPALPVPSPESAKAAVAALAKKARQADGVTVSNTTGYGVVGSELRIDPSRLR